MTEAVPTPATDTPPWRVALAELWERLFWLRVAAGLGLGVFALLVSGKHFFDEYRLGRDGVGVSAILPEQLPPPPYRLGSFYPMPLRFLHPETRETIEINQVNVPGEALRAAAGGETVAFRYLPSDPRVSDFPSYENRPWGGLVVGLVLFLGSALAGLARVGAAPPPEVELDERPPEQRLSGLGPAPGPLPPPLPGGPLPEPLTGVQWEGVPPSGRARGGRGLEPPTYLHAGRDPPSRLPSLGDDDPVTRPFLPVDLDLDEVDPPLPAYVAMPATGAAQAGEWRLGQPEEVFPTPEPDRRGPRRAPGPAVAPADPVPWTLPTSRPVAPPGEGHPPASRLGGPLAAVSLPVFGAAAAGPVPVPPSPPPPDDPART